MAACDDKIIITQPSRALSCRGALPLPVRVRVSVFGTRIDYGPNNKINFTQTQAALCGSHRRNFIQFVRFIHTTFSHSLSSICVKFAEMHRKKPIKLQFCDCKIHRIIATRIPLTWNSMPRGIEISAPRPLISCEFRFVRLSHGPHHFGESESNEKRKHNGPANNRTECMKYRALVGKSYWPQSSES